MQEGEVRPVDAAEPRIEIRDARARHFDQRLFTGDVVSYEELFDVVKSGRNRDNVRKHVSTIRDAFREVDPNFEGIENVPMRGFRWAAPAPVRKAKP